MADSIGEAIANLESKSQKLDELAKLLMEVERSGELSTELDYDFNNSSGVNWNSFVDLETIIGEVDDVISAVRELLRVYGQQDKDAIREKSKAVVSLLKSA